MKKLSTLVGFLNALCEVNRVRFCNAPRLPLPRFKRYGDVVGPFLLHSKDLQSKNLQIGCRETTQSVPHFYG